MVIDAATRRLVVETVLTRIREAYVFPQMAGSIETSIRQRLELGEYDTVANTEMLAALLTNHLREISGDLHFRLVARTAPVPEYPLPGGVCPEAEAYHAERGRQTNFGFRKVEVLNDNIGYLDIVSFDFEPAQARATVAAAMAFVANTRSLIIDLRANRGGEPAMVQLVASYLFGFPPVQLSSIYWRPSNETQEFWTLSDVPGTRYPVDRNVLLLAGRKTYSGAEAFCYDLQQLNRAVVIGERTGGAAHPVWPYRVQEYLELLLPIGRAINPFSGTNWERVGVQPTIESDADKALCVAVDAALKADR